MSKWILITVDRAELNIITEECDTKEEAHDKMLAEVLDNGRLSSVDELIDLADSGEAGYSDDEAWIETHYSGTMCWKIVEVKV